MVVQARDGTVVVQRTPVVAGLRIIPHGIRAEVPAEERGGWCGREKQF